MEMKRLLIMIALALTAVVLLCQSVNKPFYGHHDWNSNIWTVTARNNLERGILCTRLGQSTTSRPITDCAELGFYMNHPPLISWLLTVSYGIFGFAEWAGRLPIILISTGSVLMLYLLGEKLFNVRTGVLAAGFMMATNMFQYFGKAMNHEPLIVFGMIWAVYAYVGWVEDKKHSLLWFYALLWSAVWMGLSGWHGYFLFGFLAVVSFVKYRRLFLKSLLPIGILIGIFILHQLHTRWLSGSFNTFLFSQFLRRINLGGAAAKGDVIRFDYLHFFKQELLWTRIYYSTFLMVWSLTYVISQGWRVVKLKSIDLKTWMVVVLGVSGVFVPLLFSQQAFIHDYLLMFLMPFLALSSAVVVVTYGDWLMQMMMRPKILKQFGSGIRGFMMVLSAILVLLVFVEKRPFVQALFARDAEKQYVNLAHAIKQLDSSDGSILIESTNYWEFAYPALWNYAYGSDVEGRTDSLESFMEDEDFLEKRFEMIILIKSHPVVQETVDYLILNYPYEDVGDYLVFRL